MKKFLLLCLLCLGSAPWLSADKIPATELNPGTCTGRHVVSSRSADDALPNDSEYDNLSWAMEYKEGILSLTWLNFAANCCPEGFEAWIELKDNNHLIFHCAEKGRGLCDCICQYNIESKYTGIKAGHYKITFNTYVDVYSTEIDLYEDFTDLLRPSAGILPLSASDDKLSISAEGIISLNSNTPALVEIYDLSGLKVASVMLDSSRSLDISAFSSGIYVARTNSSVLRFRK